MATKRSASRLTKRRAPADWVHQFLIVLPSTNPLVWRRIQVSESYSFWDLHVAIQDSVGWLDCHLHEFRVVLDSKTGRLGRFGIPVDDMLEQPLIQPDWTVNVSDVLSSGDLPILYVYDFGDDWRHTLMYEGGVQLDTRGKYPRCLSGASKCPPEDCGGVHGWASHRTLAKTVPPKPGAKRLIGEGGLPNLGRSGHESLSLEPMSACEGCPPKLRTQ